MPFREFKCNFRGEFDFENSSAKLIRIWETINFLRMELGTIKFLKLRFFGCL